MSVPYCTNTDFNQEHQTCRECLSSDLLTDVAQGDIICTNCGVVAQSHNAYLGAEWRDFDDDAGQASSARCGGVLVDESKYYGGLEPTMLSSSVYGGQYNHGGERAAKEARLRQNLLKTHKVVEGLIEKRWKKQIEKKKFLANARRRKREEGGCTQNCVGDEDTEIDEASEIQDLPSAVPLKWSLHRALLLHGESNEIPSQYRDAKSERDYLRAQMDTSQRKASLEVYRANKSLNSALLKLNLTENRNAFGDVMDMMCRYASKKRGFIVRGVSTRAARGDKKLLEQHKEWNKERQMAAIGSAFIYFVCKKHRLGRSLVEICSSFRVTDINYPLLLKQDLIKPAHCSKAMNEIKLLFPDFVQSATSSALGVTPETTTSLATSAAQSNSGMLHMNDVSSTTNLVEHMMRKLTLPPAAVKAIITLVLHCKQQQLSTGDGSGTKQSTLIASVAVLVCCAGAKMRKLATDSVHSEKRKRLVHIKPRKRIKLEKGIIPTPAFVPSMAGVKVSPNKVTSASAANVTCLKTEVSLSRSPSPMPQVSRSHWQEWSHERTWARSLKLIEMSCNVSGKVIQEYYKNHLHPKRKDLLELLQKPGTQDSNTGATRKFAFKLNILLQQMAAAAPLMGAVLE